VRAAATFADILTVANAVPVTNNVTITNVVRLADADGFADAIIVARPGPARGVAILGLDAHAGLSVDLPLAAHKRRRRLWRRR
jgi:hypothetical protein